MTGLRNLMSGILMLVLFMTVPVTAPAAVDPDMVGLWHMEGTWLDASGMGNNGSPHNGVTFSVDGKVGAQSGSFDGVNDYVDVGDPSNGSLDFGTQDFSVSAWVKTSANGVNQDIFDKRGADGTGYLLGVKSDNKVYVFICAASSRVEIQSNSTVNDGKWHHVVGVLSRSGNASIYIDGLPDGTPAGISGIGNINNSGKAAVGYRDPAIVSAWTFFNGLIDEVAIYKRALSATEIQEQYRTYVVNSPTVDPVPPLTSCATLTLAGTKPADTSIVVNGSTLVPLDGTTTWQASYTLSTGTNNLAVTARDSQNFDSLPVSLTVVLDAAPPVVGATPAGGIYNSAQNVALVTNEPAIIHFTTDGSIPTENSPIYSQPISISERTTLKYFGRDLAGNASEIATESYVIDATPPVLAVSTLGDGAYTNNEILNIAGTVTDDTFVQGITVNGTAVQINEDGSFSYPLLLKNGANTVTVAATDAAGNVTEDTRTVTLDQTAPVLEVTAPADNSKTRTALLVVSGTVDKTSTVTIKVKATVQNALMDGGAFTATILLEPGYNTIEITATDLAGNQSSLKRTVIFDDQVPSLAVTMPNQDMRTNKSSLTIMGTVHDAFTKVGVTIHKDKETFEPPVLDGTFEQVVNFTEEKTCDIIVTATNEVGTSASVQRNIIYDVTPPALTIDPVTSPTSRPGQSVSGTREAGAEVTVTCSTASVGEVSYPTETTWQVDISGLSKGANLITATSADAAGNSVRVSATVVLATGQPHITIRVNPDVIWPANHRMVPVKITGGVDANGCDITSVRISVTDEYGKFGYNNLAFGSTIMLQAWRNGNDRDGRKYTITVVVTDGWGNTTEKRATVTVPHNRPK